MWGNSINGAGEEIRTLRRRPSKSRTLSRMKNIAIMMQIDTLISKTYSLEYIVVALH